MNRDEHDSFKRAIWFTSGAALAVSVFWTVFGVYVADSIRDNFKVISQLQAHATDKSINMQHPKEK